MFNALIYFLGWLALICIIVVVAFIAWARRYCCNCGKSISGNDYVFGGRNTYKCPRCKTGLDLKLLDGAYTLEPLRFWNYKRFNASAAYLLRVIGKMKKEV